MNTNKPTNTPPNPSTNPASATAYKVTFIQIGRGDRPKPEPVTITATNADDIARAVRPLIRPLLRSREFIIDVDLNAGAGLVDGGRFGHFTIAPA